MFFLKYSTIQSLLFLLSLTCIRTIQKAFFLSFFAFFFLKGETTQKATTKIHDKVEEKNDKRKISITSQANIGPSKHLGSCLPLFFHLLKDNSILCFFFFYSLSSSTILDLVILKILCPQHQGGERALKSQCTEHQIRFGLRSGIEELKGNVFRVKTKRKKQETEKDSHFRATTKCVAEKEHLFSSGDSKGGLGLMIFR